MQTTVIQIIKIIHQTVPHHNLIITILQLLFKILFSIIIKYNIIYVHFYNYPICNKSHNTFGGIKAVCNNEPTEDFTCFVNKTECYAAEARFGGIVIRPISKT